MAPLMYVLLCVAYGLSVWSLLRQGRYPDPLDTEVARGPREIHRIYRARVRREQRSRAVAA